MGNLQHFVYIFFGTIWRIFGDFFISLICFLLADPDPHNCNGPSLYTWSPGGQAWGQADRGGPGDPREERGAPPPALLVLGGGAAFYQVPTVTR